MIRRVVLVGHCAADTSMLSRLARSLGQDVTVETALDGEELSRRAQASPPPLVWINRVPGHGFGSGDGISLVRLVKQVAPDARVMLVSNYPDAQQAAIEAGAVEGFGKSQVHDPQTLERLRAALPK